MGEFFVLVLEIYVKYFDDSNKLGVQIKLNLLNKISKIHEKNVL